MRERRKSKDKISGSGATVKGKWPYYDTMNFLEFYLQRRNTTGNVPHTEAATVSFADSEETEIGDSELDGESTCRDQNMEGGLSKEEQPNKRGKRQKLTAVDIDQQYLESLKEIGKRMEETSNDSDRMFLLSLLPAMKQLSALDNMDFRVEVQEALRRKLRRNAAREVERSAYPNTSSASPALSQHSSNSYLDYTSVSEGCERNATDVVAAVHQTGPSVYNTVYEFQKMQ